MMGSVFLFCKTSCQRIRKYLYLKIYNKQKQEYQMRAKLIEVKSNQQLYSEGLRSYMIKVFNYMTLGLIVSALAAFIGAHQPVLSWLYSVTPTGIGLSAFGWLVLIAPFIIIFMFSSAVGKLNIGKAQTLFWVFSGCVGYFLDYVYKH